MVVDNDIRISRLNVADWLLEVVNASATRWHMLESRYTLNRYWDLRT
jgi:hypothetical protein